MAIRPSLNIAVPKRKNKASEYNDNFEMMMDFIDDSLQESKDYVDAYMPAISSSTKNKFLSNNGSAASWVGLGNQPFGSFIEGLILSKVSDDTIGVSAGSCYDITKTIILALASDTTKQNESQSASSTYYVYIIGNGTSVDFLITTSSSEPTLPTGYIYYRQIGYYTTDANGKIENIFYYGIDTNSSHGSGAYTPDYTAGTSITSGSTMVKNGVVYYVSGTNSSTPSNVTVNGTRLANDAPMYYTRMSGVIPVGKGDTVTYSGVSITFYPMKEVF